MCLSVRPLIVENQAMYVGEAFHSEYGNIHVFGLTASVAMKYEGSNILIFPVPCNQPLSKNNILVSRSTSTLRAMLATLKANSRTDIEAGVKTKCLLANSPGEITEVLESNVAIYVDNIEAFASFVGEFYPGCSVIMSVFDGSEEFRNFTLWTWYKPMKPEMLFLPTLTSMGTLVAINGELSCDYWAIMSTQNMKGGTEITHQETDLVLRDYLPKRVVGKHFTGWHKNADTVAATEAIQAGLSDGMHRRPFLGIQHG
ncbi:hypothetical protein C4564_05935 [Candidatus Microgenomates bacterium]|nr:MAG: hypothetical protein C4564_05935 [Candidatus Microgenomates bacterium]